MAEIAESGGGGHGKGKKRAKKSSTRVDMTPMVDLAFLLLTFFVLTSTFSKPKVMSLVYPAKPEEDVKIDQPKINNAMTFLLTEDKIFYYEGQFYPKSAPGPKGPTKLQETDFSTSGIRKVLAEGNAYVLRTKDGLDAKLEKKTIKEDEYLDALKKVKGDKKALKVLIKTDDKATCKNFIDLIDELKIASIGVIAPVEIMPSELELIKEKAK